MNKRVLPILLSALLLCGCAAATTEPPNEAKDEETEVKEAYYEALIEDLRRELLSLRADFYVKEETYRARIAELEKQLSASAEKTPEEAAFSYTLSEQGATVTAYHGEEAHVVLPERLDGHPVVAVADRAFSGCTQVESITLPKSVLSVGWFAFSGCTRLARVTLPASVTSIGYEAFAYCDKNLTVCAPSGSFAERYATSYGIRTRPTA